MFVFLSREAPVKPTPKVFGIGINKTGSTSLGAALRILGYRVCRFPRNLGQVEKADASTDSTVLANFQQLDRLFPGSQFIFTARDEESWLESARKHYAQERPGPLIRATRLAAFGTEAFDQELFRAAYQFHTMRVEHHFRHRPGDILRLNIVNEPETAWAKLCGFLGRPVPHVEFPWENNHLQRSESHRAHLRPLPDHHGTHARTVRAALAEASIRVSGPLSG